jgi:hypothetical protein
MAMQEIAKSNEKQVDSTELKQVDVKNLTENDAAGLVEDILSNPENIKQVKVFPDLWNSLNDQQKSDFVSKLEGESKDAVKDLKDL